MRTTQMINDDIKYYIEIRNKAHKERRFKLASDAQWNIDKCRVELHDVKEIES